MDDDIAKINKLLLIYGLRWRNIKQKKNKQKKIKEKKISHTWIFLLFVSEMLFEHNVWHCVWFMAL